MAMASEQIHTTEGETETALDEDSRTVTQSEHQIDGCLGYKLNTSFARKILAARKRKYSSQTDPGSCTDDVKKTADAIDYLICRDPDVKWRLGLRDMLSECRCEDDYKQLLEFLEKTIQAGIRACRLGLETNIHIDDVSAPKCLLYHDWLTLMHGLGFNTTSPDNARAIGLCDVTVGSTDELSLRGFFYIISAFKDMDIEHIEAVSSIIPDVGETLSDTLETLHRGYTIDSSKQQDLISFSRLLPRLMTSLGFYDDEDGSVGWRMAEDKDEFLRLYVALLGLFRSPTLHTLV